MTLLKKLGSEPQRRQVLSVGRRLYWNSLRPLRLGGKKAFFSKPIDMLFVSLIILIALLVACQGQTQIAVPTLTPYEAATPYEATTPLDTRVWVDPPELTLSVGQSAQITVKIDDVESLAGVEFHLSYDPNLLDIQDDDANQQGTQITLGDFLAQDFVVVNKVEQGKISASYLQLPPNKPVSGSGQLLAFTVKASTVGESVLTLETVNLADRNGLPISAKIEQGRVVIQ